MIQVYDFIFYIDLISVNCIIGCYIIKFKRESQLRFLFLPKVIN